MVRTPRMNRWKDARREKESLTLNGVLVTFVTVRFDDAKVAHADLREIFGEWIRFEGFDGEDPP